MGIWSPAPSHRLRVGRARRRVFFIAELLETRQLLSVAAAHAPIVPPVNVPAIIGPVVPSPVSNAGTTGATTSTTPTFQVIFEVFQTGFNASGSDGLTSSVFIVEGLFSTGNIAGSLGTPSTTAATESPAAAATSSGGAASSSSIAPLTATILAGPTVSNRAPVIVIVQQPLVVNLAPSTISVTTQAILATATLEEQPIQPPVLGQGFESPAGQGSELPPDPIIGKQSIPARIEVQLPATDYVEPLHAAPDAPAPAGPAQPVEAPPAEHAARVTEPVEGVLAGSIELSDWGRHPDQPLLIPQIEIRANQEYPTWSLATMVGTAAVATGGYQLLLGGSDRFNQRWIPTRRSSRQDRSRRSRSSE